MMATAFPDTPVPTGNGKRLRKSIFSQSPPHFKKTISSLSQRTESENKNNDRRMTPEVGPRFSREMTPDYQLTSDAKLPNIQPPPVRRRLDLELAADTPEQGLVDTFYEDEYAMHVAKETSTPGIDGVPPQPWIINTRTVCVMRQQGDKLGMILYSESGSYGTRVDSIKPNSVAANAGIQAQDIFVKLGEKHVLHCNHHMLVQELASMPLNFTAEVAESYQMPTSKGKYLIRQSPPRFDVPDNQVVRSNASIDL